MAEFAEEPHDERASPGFVAGLLVGGLVGAAVALLLAPTTAEDARDLLRAKAREGAERAGDLRADLAENMGTSLAPLLERGRTLVADARARLDDAVTVGRDTAEHRRADLENPHP